MRLLACLIIPFMGFLTNATQTNAQLSSDPPAHCVNRSADFYPYTGEPCKSGYQIGSGNCRKTDGHVVAVKKSGVLQWKAQSNCRLKAADLRSRSIKTGTRKRVDREHP